HDVEVPLVVRVSKPESARSDRNILEPVEQLVVGRGAALERHVRERQSPWALVGDEAPALEVLDVGDLNGQLTALLEASVREIIDLAYERVLFEERPRIAD